MKNILLQDNRSIVLVVVLLLFTQVTHAQREIVVQATPDNVIQPLLLNDGNGDIHLLFFRKQTNQMDRIGDLYYRQYLHDKKEWSSAVRVSDRSYAFTDPVGRASFAVDSYGRIHVVWYSIESGEYFYTRSDEARKNFEPHRSIVEEYIEGIDSGAVVTAKGNAVAVVWAAGDLMNEAGRTVFARVSVDGGATFGDEQRISDPVLGACACCGLAAKFAGDDELAIAYRSAINGNGRHMQLLSAGLDEGIIRAGSSYLEELHILQEWELSGCPVTTNNFSNGSETDTWLVFETEGRIVQLDIRDNSSVTHVTQSSSGRRQKNPVIAINKKGERLIAWGEAPGYVKGGKLKFQLFDSEGTAQQANPNPKQIGSIDISDYSFPAVAVFPDGSFLLLY